MRSRSHRIACLLAVLSLASPAAALGQSAGDEQYQDPFAPEPGQTDESDSTGGGGSGGSEDDGTAQDPAPAPAPSAAQDAPAAPAAATTEQLPRTGADEGLVALAGAVLLIGGVALRVRVSEPAPRRR
jgi:LPXTG-motif cell wall-anchored protein